MADVEISLPTLKPINLIIH